MAPATILRHHVAALASRDEEYSITVPKASGRAYVVHTDDRKLWEEYVRADYDFCHMGESYRDRFDYVCRQWYLDEHKAIGVAFAVGLAMVAIVLLLFFWSTKRGQKRQRALLRRQRHRHGKGVAAAAAPEELGQRTHLPLSQVDDHVENVVVVVGGEKGSRGGGYAPPSEWEAEKEKATGRPRSPTPAGGPSTESEPGYDSARLTGEFEYAEAQTVKLTTVRTAPV